MTAVFADAEALLRGEPIGRGSASPRRTRRLLMVMAIFGLGYGAVMGSFGGITPDRFEQIFYSAIKVPILLTFTFALSLPSFFVVSSLMGLRDDFGEAVRALSATQAGLTVVLASFAPFTALWYLSVPDYQQALLFNALMFGTASVTGQLMLKRQYAPLIRKDPRHRLMMRGWLLIYAFVGIQMGWVLRPFIGVPGGETTLLRSEAWGNAYLEVWGLIVRVFGG